MRCGASRGASAGDILVYLGRSEVRVSDWMYYEIHGSCGTPLLLLHGGLFNIDFQFGAVLPGLAEKREIIAVDFQAHGRTGDIDRPLTSANLGSDVVALLTDLGYSRVDVFGFSVGGAAS